MNNYSPSKIIDMIIEYERKPMNTYEYTNENYEQCVRQYALQYPNRQYSNLTLMRETYK